MRTFDTMVSTGAEMSFREIGERLGITKQMANKHYQNAMLKLCRNRKTLAEMRQLVEYKQRIKDGMEA